MQPSSHRALKLTCRYRSGNFGCSNHPMVTLNSSASRFTFKSPDRKNLGELIFSFVGNNITGLSGSSPCTVVTIGRLGRSDASSASHPAEADQRGPYPGPIGESLCWHERGTGHSGAHRPTGRSQGKPRAVTIARDESRVLSLSWPMGCGGTAPTPLTAGMGPRDSQTNYARDLTAGRSAEVLPPSASRRR